MVFSSAEVTVGLSILFIMLLLASTALLDGVSRPRLSSSVTLTAGGRAEPQPGAQAVDTPRRASSVPSR